jgi:uncharacterized membrane protein YdjX (TVP38/TMEM64 family)
LFDKKYLQATVLDLLQKIEKEEERGIIIYILGMAVWEGFGLSTIPVETAAGMAYGFRTGFLASSAGKLLGASAAFMLGRYFLRDWVHEQLKDNHVMHLIDLTCVAEPLRVAFFLKYSCFPEFVKNFGSAVLDPIRFWMFLLATVIHGCSFTYLWSWLGDDTAKRLEDENLPVDRPLRVAIGVGMSVGLLLSPTLMGWWVRDMRRTEQEEKRKR